MATVRLGCDNPNTGRATERSWRMPAGGVGDGSAQARGGVAQLRLEAPAGLQLTLFTELGAPD